MIALLVVLCIITCSHVDASVLTRADYQNAEEFAQRGSPKSDIYKDKGRGFLEGDIHIQKNLQTKNGVSKHTVNSIRDASGLWKDGVVPYSIESKYNYFERQTIAAAFLEISNLTCVKFRPKKASDKDYVAIGKFYGCYSNLGRIGGKQDVSLDSGCMLVGTVIHELMHALGFMHEQSAWDRDGFITVHYGNIQPRFHSQFGRHSWRDISHLNTPYDYTSVMHYHAFAFASNYNSPTITPRKSNAKIGQAVGLSAIDAYRINKLYKCPVDKQSGTISYTWSSIEDRCSDKNPCERGSYYQRMSLNLCSEGCAYKYMCTRYADAGFCMHPVHSIYMQAKCNNACIVKHGGSDKTGKVDVEVKG